MPFKELPEGQTHACTHTTDGTVCAYCVNQLKKIKFPLQKWEEEFDKRFCGNKSFGWSEQDMDGYLQIVNFIRSLLDKAENERYWSSCDGCPAGHSSFWKTITESKEWEAWEKVANSQGFDYDESRECGNFSPKHWQAFINYILENKR